MGDGCWVEAIFKPNPSSPLNEIEVRQKLRCRAACDKRVTRCPRFWPRRLESRRWPDGLRRPAARRRRAAWLQDAAEKPSVLLAALRHAYVRVSPAAESCAASAVRTALRKAVELANSPPAARYEAFLLRIVFEELVLGRSAAGLGMFHT